MRRQHGANLVEMAVAIGLSSAFILLISNMLSQTMRLATASQNELIASSSAELLLENAKNIPYDTLTDISLVQTGIDYDLVVNKKTTSVFTYPLRSIPVQLDLIDNNTIYGSVDATNGSIDLASRWTEDSGNFFRGKISENFSDASLKAGIPSVEVTVTVSYPFTESNSLKSLTRKAYIFKDGAKYQ